MSTDDDKLMRQAVLEVADALRWLGNGERHPHEINPVGAIQGHARVTTQASELIFDGLVHVAEGLKEIAAAIREHTARM